MLSISAFLISISNSNHSVLEEVAMATPPYVSLSIASPRWPTLYPPPTILMPKEQFNCSLRGSSQLMAFQKILCRIEESPLLQSSPSRSSRPYISNKTSLRLSTLAPTDRPKESTRSLNNTFAATLTINNPTGALSDPSQNSPTTTRSTLQQKQHPSLPTLDITPSLPLRSHG